MTIIETQDLLCKVIRERDSLQREVDDLGIRVEKLSQRAEARLKGEREALEEVEKGNVAIEVLGKTAHRVALERDFLRARVAVLEGALRGYVNGDACSCGDVKYGAHECSYCSGRAALTPQAQPPAEVRTNPDPLLPGLAVAIRIVAARLRTSRALRYSEVFTAALDEVLVFLRAEEERAIHPETASLTTTCTAQPAQGIAEGPKSRGDEVQRLHNHFAKVNKQGVAAERKQCSQHPNGWVPNDRGMTNCQECYAIHFPKPDLDTLSRRQILGARAHDFDDNDICEQCQSHIYAAPYLCDGKLHKRSLPVPPDGEPRR